MDIEGFGDLVEVFRYWLRQENLLEHTSRTVSAQFFDFCKANGLTAYASSNHPQAKKEVSEQFYVLNRPKLILEIPILYHFCQILYGLRVLGSALRRRPKYIITISGVTFWYMLAPLKLMGIKIIPLFHLLTILLMDFPFTGDIAVPSKPFQPLLLD